ncbi:MAG TPA: hypothetical protein VJ770_25430 [Stellaceae bacterium]|nr:hypothetical protein [Stellaceae bacterium]
MPVRDPVPDLAKPVCRTGFAGLLRVASDATTRDITDTLGCMPGGSGAAGAGKLLGLDGAPTKRLQAGQVAGTGVFAAILAGGGQEAIEPTITGRQRSYVPGEATLLPAFSCSPV